MRFRTGVGERVTKEPGAPRTIVLFGAFAGAFLVAWLVVLAVFFSLRGGESRSAVVSKPASFDVFSDAVTISRSGTVLTVAHHPSLNPSDSDFMMFVWFKLGSELPPEEPSTFLAKYDPKRPNSEGYAIALIGGADGVRPYLYWRDDRVRGRWYAFASTHIARDTWYVLGVTFRARRYLGVHIAPFGPDASPEVLGGYDLDGMVVPASSANISIGAVRKSKFRGQVGPFGIFNAIDVSKDASSIMKKLARDPSFANAPVEESQIALWASPTEDLGPLRLEIQD